MIDKHDYIKIPQQMREYKNWVLFKLTPRKNGKMTKPPYQPDGSPAKANDPATWSTFAAVVAAMKRQPSIYAGIGFQFEYSPFMGVDVDGCIDNKGNFSDLALEALNAIGSYAEISPSGHGLHIIIKGKLKDGRRGGKNSKIGLEIYDKGRYFTMTGDTIAGFDKVGDNLPAVHALHDKYIRAAEYPQEKKANKGISRFQMKTDRRADSDKTAAIIEQIRASRQRELFEKLFDRGDISDYGGDDSAADMALMNILPFWTGGAISMMLDIFSRSKLADRDKWKRGDYQARTVQAALKNWNGKTYNPAGARLNRRKIETMAKGQHIDKSPDELQKLAAFNLTDTGNAERLHYIHRDKLLYCTKAGRWLKWDGRRWHYCEAEATELYNTVSGVMRLSAKQYEAAYGTPTNKQEEKKRRAYRAFFKKSENQVNIINTIKRARAFFPVDINDLDSHDWLLNCQNGTIDLKTGALQAHDKSQLITQICNAGYNAAARSILWEKTISQIIPDDDSRHWLQKYIGYCLTGSVREEKFLCLYGEGGGGKGTFIETIGKILGDYADTVPIDVILTARSTSNGNEPTPQIAKMRGKRLILMNESGKGRKFKDETMKGLTGGDMISARCMYGMPFTYKPHFKLVMSTNFMPSVTDATDTGVKRRLIIAPFTANLDDIRDMTLKERLLFPQEREAILNWCVKGCMMWQKEGLQDLPQSIKRMMIDYYTDNDLLTQFIEERCSTGENLRVKVKDLHRAYNQYLDDGGSCWTGIKLSAFKEDMRRRGFEIYRPKNIATFKGIELKVSELN